MYFFEMCSLPRGILFLSRLQKIQDLASKEIASNQNLIDEIIGVIEEFLELDRNTKDLIPPLIHVLCMLINYSFAIRYGALELMAIQIFSQIYCMMIKSGSKMTTENHDVNAAEKNRDFCGSRRQCDYRQTDRETVDRRSEKLT